MNIKLLHFDTYLSIIKNSVGSKVFNNSWMEIDGKRQDALDNGRKSCGFFVSGILLWFHLIKERHVTAAGTLKDMKESGWFIISEPKPGAILHWEKLFGNGEWNEHIGFCIDQETAISSDREVRGIIEHHITYGKENGEPKRKILGIYWHPKLDEWYSV